MRGCQLRKLLKLKDWVTVAEAARYLSAITGEEVGEPDLIRLALDRHLTLSVRLINGAYARCWIPVSPDEVQWNEAASLDGNGIVRLPVGGPVWMPEDGGPMQLQPSVIELFPGVWDLPMVGPECLNVEREYQRLIGGAEFTRMAFDGVVMTREADGLLYQLQANFADLEGFDRSKLRKPFNHPENFFLLLSFRLTVNL